MSRKNSSPCPPGIRKHCGLHPAPSPFLEGFWFCHFGSPRISAAMPTPGDGFQIMVSSRRGRLTPIRCEATQAHGLALVPTIILCEARGLWLFWVIRGGIGLTRRLGAQCSTRRLMSVWILSLEPERRRTDWPSTRYENLGEQLSSVQRSSGLRLQLFGVETFLLLPKCQGNGRDLPR